jgi:beta-N-acetylhexosaminidase
MIKFLLIIYIFLAGSTVFGSDETELKKMISRMLVVGFDEEKLDDNSTIIKQIKRYELGGVILFDRFYTDRNKTKNIRSPKQLKLLTQTLQNASKKPLLIAVDQEGGKVARLKESYGFIKTKSAKEISKLSLDEAKSEYEKLAKELHVNGINCNFAPVVDLAVNPKNYVIYQLERSYGSDAPDVSEYAATFIDALRDNGVISVLKHFPGHGSSLGDSHKGFVDVSDTWSEKELEPYKILIDQERVDMIMTAHVFNSHLDSIHPATLSYSVNTKLLRDKLGFKGVIISDDLQMNAIAEHYSLKEIVTLAINSGVDMLLFADQLNSQNLDKLIDIIYESVKDGDIAISRIFESNRRIEELYLKRIMKQKPIIFNQERIDMTKSYIKEHYGLHVRDIEINPKIILLHWTALESFEDSFLRLKPQKLFSDRKDIAKAGALNVSAHYLVDRDGAIYQLMPDNYMARHVIGLNYSSIGIENVGGKDNKEEDLTEAQVRANVALIRYLKSKYPDIEYLVGHHEYRLMEKTPLWLEKDSSYRTKKSDPGVKFMKSVREEIEDLNLKAP